MRRAARLLLYLGTVAAVLLLGKYHARYIADPIYDFTGSFRSAWSPPSAARLCVAASPSAPPALARPRRSAVLSALGAAAAAAFGISLLQLLLGSALLP